MMLLLLACSGSPDGASTLPPSPGPTPLSGQPGQMGQPGPPPGGHGPPGGTPDKGFHAEPTFQLTEAPGTPQRSMLIISLDTVRADSLALYGGPADLPAVQALAEGGAVFDQAVTHFPQTCSSHWSMMTGVLPELHGNTPANRGSLYSGPTVAEIAQRHGYATAGFVGGQTLLDGACGLARGFEVYDDDFRFDQADLRRPGPEVVAAASAWVEQQEGPWFAFVHLFDAHFPYTPEHPERFDPGYTGTLTGSDSDLGRYRAGEPLGERDLRHVRALYDAEVQELDAMIAPLLEQIGEDVLVVVTSDHGESFEHDYLFNHKDSLYEGVLRVPLVLSGPGVPAGRRGAQFGLMDLAPTLLLLAGLPRDDRMQGEAWAERGTVYSITGPWEPDTPDLLSARSVGAKRIESVGGASCFDLTLDPAEGSPQPCPKDGSAYRQALEALSEYQVDPPEHSTVIGLEECLRLQALGYTTCNGQGGRPGAPPLRR